MKVVMTKKEIEENQSKVKVPCRIIHLELPEANYFVTKYHRHHTKVAGHRFSLGAAINDHLVGVVIVSRPVSKGYDFRSTVEVTRLCTTGEMNICSILYSAAARASELLGFEYIQTYTLPEEGGSSLRAAGFTYDGDVKATTRKKPWISKGRENRQISEISFKDKWRWVKKLKPMVRNIYIKDTEVSLADSCV